MQQYQPAGQVDPQYNSNDAVNRVLRQAEISRLTRNLKSKLALASLKTQKTPDGKSTQPDARRRSKTLEGASPSPRPLDTPISTRPRSASRRSSINSISSVSSMGSIPSVASPRARIPRINSVNSIVEARFEGPKEPFYPAGSRTSSHFSSLQSQQLQLQHQHQHQLQQLQQNQQSQHQQFRQQQRRQFQQQPHYPPSLGSRRGSPGNGNVGAHPIGGFESSPTGGLERGLSDSHFYPSEDLPGANGARAVLRNSDQIYQQQLQQPISMHDHEPADRSEHRSEMAHREVASGDSGQLPRRSPPAGNSVSVSSAHRAQGQIKLQVDDEPLPAEPSTPPPLRRLLPQTPERHSDPSASDGASLLLHFAHSPGRGTPRTPDFNMSDYLHFQTPSPARGGQLTPHRLRWGSLNSALFNQAGNNSLAPPAIPDLMHPAGSGSDTNDA